MPLLNYVHGVRVEPLLGSVGPHRMSSEFQAPAIPVHLFAFELFGLQAFGDLALVWDTFDPVLRCV